MGRRSALLGWMAMVDRLQLHDLLRQLVAVDSVNPTLVPGARGEAAAAEFLRGWLKGQGIEARLQEAAPGRPNVVAWLGPQPAQAKGEKPRAALAILAHIDTVGAGDMANPFTPRVRDGRLYGRGALDIKSGVAAMCAAAVGGGGFGESDAGAGGARRGGSGGIPARLAEGAGN